jgi:aminoglycoside 3-N-acetyltransferase
MSRGTSKYNVDALSEHLRAMGLERGSIVLVRAAVKAIGPIEDSARSLVKALIEVIGPEGTLLGLAFTKTFFFPSRHPEYVFDGTNSATTGGFVAAMLGWPGAIRSAHPTNSFVGIGAQAGELLRGHNETATCFSPLEKLIEGQGKMMLIGCLDDSPGFSTVHLVQAHLGLSKKSLLGPLTGVLYRRGGQVRVFTKRDIPGCSAGFGIFYKDYEKVGILRSGKVGDADALVIDAKEAYDIEYELIRSNPRYPLCNNSNCLFCRGSLLYNKRDMIGFYIRQLSHLMRRALHSL